jgi:hypothetical protein
MHSPTAFVCLLLAPLALATACGRTALELPDVVPVGDDSGTVIVPPPGLDSGFDDDVGHPLPVDTGVVAPEDAGVDSAPPPPVAALRLIAPLSTSTVTSQLPILHWALPSDQDGAQIDICRDRACETEVELIATTGASAQPAAPLVQGVYYWRARGTRNGVVVTDDTPVWEFWVGALSATVANTSWGTTLDVNGDGFADVAIGAPFANADQSGAAYVYLGGVTSVGTTPALTLAGPAGSNSGFGNVASAGDVNGDGFGDLLVGADETVNLTGSVYVYLGGDAGLAATPAAVMLGPGGVGGIFGGSLASAGDVNGDGFADVIVGAFQVPDAASNGAAYVYLGSAAGLATEPAFTFAGFDGANARFGAAVASAGDLNGDGFGDVIVGAPLAGDLDSGDAYVYFGSASGLSATPGLSLSSPGANEFGTSVANAGDVNGDGFADLVVGGYLGSAGAAFQYLGGTSGPSSIPSTTLTQPAVMGVMGLFGLNATGAGDVNDDGYADVIVGSPFFQGGAGSAFLYLGSPSGLASAAVTTLAPSTGGEFGDATAGAGDVNGDGYADVIIGGSGDGMKEAGYSFLYFGVAAGGVSGPTIFSGPAGSNGFGLWVASALDVAVPGPG